jgi:hypothetical protein
VPLPQDPASSLSKAIYIPAQTFVIKIPHLFQKTKKTFLKKKKKTRLKTTQKRDVKFPKLSFLFMVELG